MPGIFRNRYPVTPTP